MLLRKKKKDLRPLHKYYARCRIHHVVRRHEDFRAALSNWLPTVIMVSPCPIRHLHWGVLPWISSKWLSISCQLYLHLALQHCMVAKPKLLPCLWMFSRLCTVSHPAVSWALSPSLDKRLFDVLLQVFIY